VGWFTLVVGGIALALVPAGASAQRNLPPSASFGWSPSVPRAGDTVVFQSTSSDPEGRIARYSWDLDGDGRFGEEGEPNGPDATSATRTFADPGQYSVGLAVVDGVGQSDVATETVTVAPAAGPPLPGANEFKLQAMRTTVHGPVVLPGRELARFRPPRVPKGELGEEALGEGVGCTALCGEGSAEAITTAFSPRLKVSWDAPIDPASGVIDPQIAAGPSYLLVTLRHRFFILDKAGNLAYDKTGTKQLGAISSCDFFDPLSNSMNSSLNLPSPLSVAGGYGMDCATYSDTYYDARAIFDPYRKRYWIVALALNKKANDADDAQKFPGRRGKFAVAVSKTSDPRGGWYLYWTDAVAGDGEAPLCPNGSCPVITGADYPSIGISPKYVALATHSGPSTTPGRRVVLGPADALAAGCPGQCPAWAFDDVPGQAQLSDFPNPDGGHKGYHIEPAVHHSAAPFGGFLTAYMHLDGSKPEGDPARYHLVVWELFPPDPPPPQNVVVISALRMDIPVAPWLNVRNLEQAPSPPDITTPRKVQVNNLRDNIGPILLKLAYRDGLLFATFQDCAFPKDPAACHSAIRLVRAPVLGGGLKIDDTFGKANKADPEGTLAAYGMPAVEVNKDGNAALTYIRAGTTIFPEARYSVLYGNEDDVRPSRALHAGDYTLGKQNSIRGATEAVTGKFDISGISVDGFDDTGIWMIDPYSTKVKNKAQGQWQLAVGKVFGKRRSDLQIERIRRRLKGRQLTLGFRTRNLGDGRAVSTKLRVSLVRRASASASVSRGRALRLRTIRLRRLGVGRTRSVKLKLRLPSAGRRRGYRFLRVELDAGARLREYSERNNTTYLRLP
jgi:PKD repeat protein